jgi:xanthine dehydrogenase molybdenum-binding subunit
MTRATTHSAGPYEIDHVKSDCYAVYTDNPPAGAFRGFGVLQAAFAIESLMDVLAGKLGLDPVALRRINALRVGSVTNTGQVLRQSVGLLECIDKVDAEMRRLAGNHDPFAPEEVAGKPYLRRAWGFAVGYKNTGLGGGAPDRATAEVELLPNGIFEARISSAELGQGLPAVLQSIAAEELGQDLEQVRVLLSDTDLTPDGGPTTASRQTYMSGNAVRHSADSLRDNITADLAERFDVPPDGVQFRPGAILVGERKLSLQEVSALLRTGGGVPKLAYTYDAPATRPLGEGGDMHFAFSFAAQAAQVEVDTRTGEVRVLRLVSANDVGYAINPLGLRGQIEGGAMMGLGHTLTERFQLKDGVVLSDRMARYRMPSIELTPEFTSFVVEHPSEDGPFGAKGSGELVTIPTAPAIANAVTHAVGVHFDNLPIDQERIAMALEAA